MRSAFRKIWSRYSIEKEHCLYLARHESLKYKVDGTRSKIPFISYQCANCNLKFKEKEVQVDHVDPVGSTPEPSDHNGWALWLAKLFVSESRLRVLCKPCHSKTTKEQRQIVSKLRRNNKNTTTDSDQGAKVA